MNRREWLFPAIQSPVESDISADGSPWMPIAETNLQKCFPVFLAKDIKAASCFLAEASFIGMFKPGEEQGDSAPVVTPPFGGTAPAALKNGNRRKGDGLQGDEFLLAPPANRVIVALPSRRDR